VRRIVETLDSDALYRGRLEVREKARGGGEAGCEREREKGMDPASNWDKIGEAKAVCDHHGQKLDILGERSILLGKALACVLTR